MVYTDFYKLLDGLCVIIEAQIKQKNGSFPYKFCILSPRFLLGITVFLKWYRHQIQGWNNGIFGRMYAVSEVY